MGDSSPCSSGVCNHYGSITACTIAEVCGAIPSKAHCTASNECRWDGTIINQHGGVCREACEHLISQETCATSSGCWWNAAVMNTRGGLCQSSITTIITM